MQGAALLLHQPGQKRMRVLQEGKSRAAVRLAAGVYYGCLGSAILPAPCLHLRSCTAYCCQPGLLHAFVAGAVLLAGQRAGAGPKCRGGCPGPVHVGTCRSLPRRARLARSSSSMVTTHPTSLLQEGRGGSWSPEERIRSSVWRSSRDLQN